MLTHIALPIQVAANGRLTSVVQDSEADIAQSTALLLATRTGDRRSVTDYGTPDPVFGGVSADDIADAIATWEDRADPTFVEELSAAVVEQFVSVYPSPPAEEEAE